ncbi:transcriptional regulator [Paenibacillus sp. IHB B 3084]|uniref:TetR/AcrR family transcriptional regulator n=1 Tax=unclassified Paenibacillus TaxID=185978 RepID=UPI000721C123|nr:TetR/AcrR family transcriptional regulator [Paenibacillus sp. IHB B 3084]ALP36186.1 transcriptional regulator [Paenibacillus sp. IHB B 3084]MBE0338066.1 TetR/AcrR family transcriptional regulator [Paenibacillus sp. 23TSA30-6]
MTRAGVRSREGRRLLLEAGAEEFAQTGFYQTKVSSIAARAGLTQPDFYIHFESKEQMYEELVESFRVLVNETVQCMKVEPDQSQAEILSRGLVFLESIFRMLSNNPAITRVGFYQASDSVRIKAEMAGHIKKHLLAAQRWGSCREELDPELTAECVVGLIERLTLTKLLTGSESPSVLAKQTRNLLYHGMLAHEG